MNKKAVIALATLSCLTLSSLVSANTTEATPVSGGRTFYVSSTSGSDTNNGLSQSSPFKTLSKINEIELRPGDTVLLENGSIFNDQFLHIRGSGSEASPIRISNYGVEGQGLPTINTNGQGIWYQDYGKQLDNPNHKWKGNVSSSILLKDVEYIEVSNLAITNQGPDEGKAYNDPDFINRTGVAVVSQNKGTVDHVYLNALHITNVQGNVYDKHMNNGGIYFTTFKPTNEAATGISRYNDVKVTNSYIENVNRWGIALAYTAYWDQFQGREISEATSQQYGATNVLIENNFLRDVGGDAITTMYAHRPIVQRNVAVEAAKQINDTDYSRSRNGGKVAAAIWPWKSKDALFQYNEVYDTNYNQDGQAWDADSGDGTIYQYNYSHNNEGGAVMFCYPEAYRNTFRYNISHKDLGGVLSPSNNPDAAIYNNTFIVAENTDLIRTGQAGGQMDFENNILYYTGSTPKQENWTKGNTGARYKNNLYYNYANLPNDPNAVTEDPKFAGDISQAPVAPNGTSVHDSTAFAMFKLSDDSPAIDRGIRQANHLAQDYFGVEVDALPDLGASESLVASPNLILASAVYRISETSVSEVPKRTSVATLKSNLSASRGAIISVVSADGTVKADEELVRSGDKVRLTRGEQVKEYTIELGKTFEEYAPNTTTAEVGSFQPNNASEGDGSKALDNSMSTMWHTNWNGDSRDKMWISLDLGESKQVSMFKYVPRSSVSNGIITKYEIQVSDDKTTWRTVASGDWARDTTTKIAEFPSTQARYIKLQAVESYSNQAGKNFASAAEVRTGYEILEEGEVHRDSSKSLDSSIYQVVNQTMYIPSTEANPTTAEAVLAGITVPEKATKAIVDGQGSPVTGAIAAGQTLRITAENGETSDYQLEIKNTYSWAMDYVNRQQGNVWFAQKKSGESYQDLTTYDNRWPNWSGGNFGTVGIDAQSHAETPTESTHGLLAASLGETDSYAMTYRVPKAGTVTFTLKDGEPYIRQAGNTGGSVIVSLSHNGRELASVTLTESNQPVAIPAQTLEVAQGDFLRVEARNLNSPSKFSVHATPIISYENIAITSPVVVDKEALRTEVAGKDALKESANYSHAETDKKTAYDTALTQAEQVLANDVATQEEVNQALTTLQAAKEALNGDAVAEAVTSLMTLVDSEETVKTSAAYVHDTAEKKAAYDTALASAKTSLGAEQLVLASLLENFTSLDAAQRALAGVEPTSEQPEQPEQPVKPEQPVVVVDKSALATEVGLEPATKLEVTYLQAEKSLKEAYETALVKAKEVLDSATADKTAVDTALASLQAAKNALNGLEKIAVETRLTTLLAEQIPLLTQVVYLQASPEKKATYDVEHAALQTLLASEERTVAGLLAQEEKLLAARGQLDGKVAENPEQPVAVDKTALENLLALSQQVKNSENYTLAETGLQVAYQTSLDQATTLLASAEATQEAVNAQVELIRTSQANLNGLEMKELLAELNKLLESETKLKESVLYLNSTESVRVGYDQASQAAKELKESLAKTKLTLVETLKNLKEAHQALDGKEVVEEIITETPKENLVNDAPPAFEGGITLNENLTNAAPPAFEGGITLNENLTNAAPPAFEGGITLNENLTNAAPPAFEGGISLNENLLNQAPPVYTGQVVVSQENPASNSDTSVQTPPSEQAVDQQSGGKSVTVRPNKGGNKKLPGTGDQQQPYLFVLAAGLLAGAIRLFTRKNKED
ncbi:TPA: discoidin domain-containing protein [Streptococcus suis]